MTCWHIGAEINAACSQMFVQLIVADPCRPANSSDAPETYNAHGSIA